MGSDFDDRDLVYFGFSWLAAVRPLVMDGSIIFASKSAGNHPGVVTGIVSQLEGIGLDEWRTAGLEAADSSEMRRELSQLSRELGGERLLGEK